MSSSRKSSSLSSRSVTKTTSTRESNEKSEYRALVEEVLCGKSISSIEKSKHKHMLAPLSDIRKKALFKQDYGLLRRVDAILKNLCLAPDETGGKQTKTRSSASTMKYRNKEKKQPPEIEEELNQIESGKKSINDVEPEHIYGIRTCLRKRQKKAIEDKEYKKADHYTQELDELYKMSQRLPKNISKKTNPDLENSMKIKYRDYKQKIEEIKNNYENEKEELDNEHEKALKTITIEFDKEYAEIEDQKEQIATGEDFRPSKDLVELRKTESVMARNLQFADAELASRKGHEIEMAERKEYDRKWKILLKRKEQKLDIAQKNRVDSLNTFWNDRKQKAYMKFVHDLSLAENECEAIEARADQLKIDLDSPMKPKQQSPEQNRMKALMSSGIILKPSTPKKESTQEIDNNTCYESQSSEKLVEEIKEESSIPQSQEESIPNNTLVTEVDHPLNDSSSIMSVSEYESSAVAYTPSTTRKKRKMLEYPDFVTPKTPEKTEENKYTYTPKSNRKPLQYEEFLSPKKPAKEEKSETKSVAKDLECSEVDYSDTEYDIEYESEHEETIDVMTQTSAKEQEDHEEDKEEKDQESEIDISQLINETEKLVQEAEALSENTESDYENNSKSEEAIKSEHTSLIEDLNESEIEEVKPEISQSTDTSQYEYTTETVNEEEESTSFLSNQTYPLSSPTRNNDDPRYAMIDLYGYKANELDQDGRVKVENSSLSNIEEEEEEEEEEIYEQESVHEMVDTGQQLYSDQIENNGDSNNNSSQHNEELSAASINDEQQPNIPKAQDNEHEEKVDN